MINKENLDDWQKEFLEHDGNQLLCTGRQVGKTTIMAIKAGDYLINHKNSKIIVCSLTEDQAQLIIVMVLDYLERNYKPYLKGAKKATKNNIWLNNKSEILARPVGNTGDAIRGFTGNVLILDEMSRMPELAFLAGKPTLLTTGGQIWACSTPAGKQGYFYECFLNKEGRFRVFHISSEEVLTNRKISESWTEKQREQALKFLEDEKGTMSKLAYAQEYLGLFTDDLQRLFTDELINKVCILEKGQGQPVGKKFLGVDVGGMGEDESTFEIITKISKEKYIQDDSIITKRTRTTETTSKVLELNKIYNFRKIGIDNMGLGAGVLDPLLKESSVRDKVVGLNNASKELTSDGKKKATLLKEDMYFTLLSLMEQGKIKLLNDDNLMLSLRSVQYEYVSKPGQITKLRVFGSYTHIVEGLIRACWLAVQDNSLDLWASFKGDNKINLNIWKN